MIRGLVAERLRVEHTRYAPAEKLQGFLGTRGLMDCCVRSMRRMMTYFEISV